MKNLFYLLCITLFTLTSCSTDDASIESADGSISNTASLGIFEQVDECNYIFTDADATELECLGFPIFYATVDFRSNGQFWETLSFRPDAEFFHTTNYEIIDGDIVISELDGSFSEYFRILSNTSTTLVLEYYKITGEILPMEERLIMKFEKL